MEMSEEEAQAKLDAAVDEYFRAVGWSGFCTGWILVAHQHRSLEEGNEESAYPIVYMGGTMPDHAAIGLLQIGSDVVRGAGRWSAEDED